MYPIPPKIAQQRWFEPRGYALASTYLPYTIIPLLHQIYLLQEDIWFALTVHFCTTLLVTRGSCSHPAVDWLTRAARWQVCRRTTASGARPTGTSATTAAVVAMKTTTGATPSRVSRDARTANRSRARRSATCPSLEPTRASSVTRESSRCRTQVRRS